MREHAMQWGITTLSVLCLAFSAHAQRPATLNGSVRLQELPPLAKGLASFPRVVPGPEVSNAIAAKINASLQRMDNTVVQAAKECREELQESQGQGSSEGWTRSVHVTMNGPAFLSMEASDLEYCGGAYPQGGTSPMVYDLSTGRPLNWKTVLPDDAVADTDSALDGTILGLVIWKPLDTVALRAANKGCREVLRDEKTMRFLLSLDGRTGSLVARVFDLPHAVDACEGPFRISAKQAQQLGVSGRITDALTASSH